MAQMIPYVDGCVRDAIPLRRALEDKKCDRAVVLFTRPEWDKPTDYRKYKIPLWVEFHKKYPELYEVLMRRHELYAAELEYCKRMESEGRALLIRPTIPSIKHFETDKAKLQNYYIHGMDTARIRMPEIKEFLGIDGQLESVQNTIVIGKRKDE